MATPILTPTIDPTLAAVRAALALPVDAEVMRLIALGKAIEAGKTAAS